MARISSASRVGFHEHSGKPGHKIGAFIQIMRCRQLTLHFVDQDDSDRVSFRVGEFAEVFASMLVPVPGTANGQIQREGQDAFFLW